MARYGWCDPVAEGTATPGLVDEDERSLAKAEIDAIVARDLFELSAEELGRILDTFAVLQRREEEQHKELRTKRLVLEAYTATSSTAAGNANNLR